MDKAEMIARISRLEEMVVALMNHENATQLGQQIDAELYTQNRLPSAYPCSMEMRMQEIREALEAEVGDES